MWQVIPQQGRKSTRFCTFLAHMSGFPWLYQHHTRFVCSSGFTVRNGWPGLLALAEQMTLGRVLEVVSPLPFLKENNQGTLSFLAWWIISKLVTFWSPEAKWKYGNLVARWQGLPGTSLQSSLKARLRSGEQLKFLQLFCEVQAGSRRAR